MRAGLIICSLITCISLFFLPSCRKREETAGNIVVKNITPGEAFVGEAVEISGSGFSNIPDENKVFFNSIAARVSSASTGKLTAVVPEGAATGKVRVEVKGASFTFTAGFVVKEAAAEAPVITGFFPESAAPGAEITLSGRHFSTVQEEDIIYFNETVAEVKSADTTSVKVVVPAGAATGKISITVKGRKTLSEKVFVVEDTAAAAPVITGFTPGEGVTQDEVAISGSHFSRRPEENLVYFNNVRAMVTYAADTLLKVQVPENAVTGKLRVKVNGKEMMSARDFTVIQPPVITGFSPESGPVGSEIILQGAHFSSQPSENSVFFNHLPAIVTAASTSQLSIKVPDGATTGKISVIVNGMNAKSAGDFTIEVPVCSPNSIEGEYNATRGAEYQLYAICLSETLSENIVRFNNGAPAKVLFYADASWISPGYGMLVVEVPADATSGPISITVNGNTGVSQWDCTIY